MAPSPPTPSPPPTHVHVPKHATDWKGPKAERRKDNARLDRAPAEPTIDAGVPARAERRSSAAALRVHVTIDAPKLCVAHRAAPTERCASTIATDAGAADASDGLASAGEGEDALRRRRERRVG